MVSYRLVCYENLILEKLMKSPFVFTVLIWISLILPSQASAEVQDKWSELKETYFPGKTVESNKEIIKLSAPKRAESGAQVPFSFSIDYPMNANSYVKSVHVLVGVNPIPVVGVFHFFPESGKAEISTRIRLETDSYVHVVAETSDGNLYMNAIPVRATGGCGGTVEGDEKSIRISAGRMKFHADENIANDQIVKGTLLIKHPMYTGLQRDLVSQGFRPAFFINKAVIKYNSKKVMDADLYIGMSEDPNIQFSFVKNEASGLVEVEIQDNEGGIFTKSSEL